MSDRRSKGKKSSKSRDKSEGRSLKNKKEDDDLVGTDKNGQGV